MAEKTPREQIAEGLAGSLTKEQVSFLIDEVLAITKKPWATCPACNKRLQVDVPDAAAVARALKDLLAEGFGRPGGDESVDRVTIVNEVVLSVPRDA